MSTEFNMAANDCDCHRFTRIRVSLGVSIGTSLLSPSSLAGSASLLSLMGFTSIFTLIYSQNGRGTEHLLHLKIAE